MTLRVSVVGLGKLGASMAGAIVSRGHRVFGYDVDPRPVAELRAGRAPVPEPGLQELLDAHRDRVVATADVALAIRETDLTFVVVPTPSEPSGSFSLRYAEQACTAIGQALAAKDGYHLVVLASTVLPGSLRYRLIPLLEQGSGRVAGRDFGVCYSPQFIALGSVVHDFLNPDLILVGELDERSGALLEEAYRAIAADASRVRRMTLENAELTKLAVNSYVTTKITFANMLADLCERIPGGDVDVVSGALGLDRRIGRRYLTGAIAYGGPCFPRDNLALSYLARALGTTAGLADATHAMNTDFVEQLAGELADVAAAGGRVAVLGLAYKPNTSVTEESPGLKIAQRLGARGARVVAYDPALDAAAGPTAHGVPLARSLEEAVAGADAVLVTTPDPAFERLAPTHGSATAPVLVLDCWRLVPALKGRPGIEYRASGQSARELENAARLMEIWQPALVPPAEEHRERPPAPPLTPRDGRPTAPTASA
jgi:UDPglucose 6-dehydrogenase